MWNPTEHDHSNIKIFDEIINSLNPMMRGLSLAAHSQKGIIVISILVRITKYA